MERIQRHAGVLLFGVSLGCGARVVSAQDWMIGVFSTPSAGELGPRLATRYYVEDDLQVTVAKDALDSPYAEQAYRWEPRTEEEYAILPNEDPDDILFPHGDGEEELLITQMGACGPHLATSIHGDSPAQPESNIFRGEVCVRSLNEGEGGNSETYWCDEPPEPCDDTEGS